MWKSVDVAGVTLPLLMPCTMARASMSNVHAGRLTPTVRYLCKYVDAAATMLRFTTSQRSAMPKQPGDNTITCTKPTSLYTHSRVR